MFAIPLRQGQILDLSCLIRKEEHKQAQSRLKASNGIQIQMQFTSARSARFV